MGKIYLQVEIRYIKMSKQNYRTKLISHRSMNCETNDQYIIVNCISSLTLKVELFQARCEYSCRLSDDCSSPLYIRKFLGRDVSRERSLTARNEERRLYLQARSIISLMLKKLDSVVTIFTHNYPSITKICCRHWILKLSSLTTFTSKFCNKLSTQFKYLNSVISYITDH